MLLGVISVVGSGAYIVEIQASIAASGHTHHCMETSVARAHPRQNRPPTGTSTTARQIKTHNINPNNRVSYLLQ